MRKIIVTALLLAAAGAWGHDCSTQELLDDLVSGTYVEATELRDLESDTYVEAMDFLPDTFVVDGEFLFFYDDEISTHAFKIDEGSQIACKW